MRVCCHHTHNNNISCAPSCNSSTYECGRNANSSFVGFSICADPKYNISCKVLDHEQLSNGFCNAQGGYNSEKCNWDGGDWCVPFGCCVVLCTT